MCFDGLIKIVARNKHINKMSSSDNENMNYFTNTFQESTAAMFANFSPQFPYFCVNFVSLLLGIVCAWQKKVPYFHPHGKEFDLHITSIFLCAQNAPFLLLCFRSNIMMMMIGPRRSFLKLA
jgi:hypothetical protein